MVVPMPTKISPLPSFFQVGFDILWPWRPGCGTAQGLPRAPVANVRRGAEPAARPSPPSMRTSYTVTLPEEPPAAPFPALAKELRPRSPLSPSLLLSTFVGLLLNKAKVRGPFPGTPTPRAGVPPLPRDRPRPPRAPRRRHEFSPAPTPLSPGSPSRECPLPR